MNIQLKDFCVIFLQLEKLIVAAGGAVPVID
jgi:hypothetical protein